MLKNLDECKRALGLIRTHQADVEVLEAACAVEIEQARERYQEAAKPAREQIARLEAELEKYYREHPPEKPARSYRLAEGAFGMRRAKPKLDTVGKTSWAKAVETVKRFLGAAYVRTKEEVDRDAVKRAAQNRSIDAEALRQARLKLTGGEDVFFVDVEEAGS